MDPRQARSLREEFCVCLWLFTVNRRLLACALLNEEVGADVEEGGQLLGLRLADGTLAVEYLGGNSFRAEKSPEALLLKTNERESTSLKTRHYAEEESAV